MHRFPLKWITALFVSGVADRVDQDTKMLPVVVILGLGLNLRNFISLLIPKQHFHICNRCCSLDFPATLIQANISRVAPDWDI